jgi:hypothetical protein
MLRAGAADIFITPPIGVELMGYGINLSRRSTGVHDNLTAQALVLDDGRTRAVLITSDLLGVSVEFTQSVRAQIQERAGIPAAHVMLSCTHSHTAPGTLPSRGIGRVDAQYAGILARYIVGAVVAAVARLEPVRLVVGRSEHAALAWNRVGRDLADPSVDVALLERESGGTLAVLAHYACHPVMLGPKSEISADYPAGLRRYLIGQYPGSVVMFMNGTCGDIDPVSNRAVWGRATFEETERAGVALGKDVQKAASKAVAVDNPQIHVSQTALHLNYDIPPIDEIRARIAQHQAKARGKEVTADVKMARHMADYLRGMEKRLLAGRLPAQEDAELQIMALGKALALLAIPAEVFTAQGIALRKVSDFDHTWPVCYANGLFGYFSPREDFEVNGYGATIAPAFFDRPLFSKDIADSLVRTATPLLKGQR